MTRTILRQSSTVPDIGAGDTPYDIDIDNMDLLELTASQKSFIMRKIQK
jgi:hypothetical protein